MYPEGLQELVPDITVCTVFPKYPAISHDSLSGAGRECLELLEIPREPPTTQHLPDIAFTAGYAYEPATSDLGQEMPYKTRCVDDRLVS